MARSTRDMAAATEVLLDPATRKELPQGGYISSLTESLKGLRIGFIDPTQWHFPPDLWVPSSEAKEQHTSIIQDFGLEGWSNIFP